jgi:hypothetical protein
MRMVVAPRPRPKHKIVMHNMPCEHKEPHETGPGIPHVSCKVTPDTLKQLQPR